MKSNKSGNFTWAVVFAWIFGIGGVAGVMYLLFTNEDYNGMGGAKIDPSLIVKIDTPKSATSSYDASTKNTPGNSSSGNKENKNDAMISKDVPKKAETPVIKAPEKPVEKNIPKPAPVAPKPLPQVAAKPKPIAVPAPKPLPVPVAKAPVPKPKPIEKTVPKPQPVPVKAQAPVAKVPSTQPKPAVKSRPVVRKADKIMSEGELSQLLTKIVESGASNGIYTRCVQLHSTSEGNNKKAMVQVENYLRSQKYSIAGRQIVSSHVNGIKVVPSGECMRVVIGSL